MLLILMALMVVLAIICGFIICEFITERRNARSALERSRRAKASGRSGGTPPAESQEKPKPDTVGLMLRTLRAIGCQPELQDDGEVEVKYQGENFVVIFGGVEVRIWDPGWSQIRSDDPDLPQVREAVNKTNFSYGTTVVMTAPDKDGMIWFHTRRDFLFHESFPDNEGFLKNVLESFFRTKEEVRGNFTEMRRNSTDAASPHPDMVRFTNLN
ncbi:MAG: hypothetical protein K2O78_07805 [Muribaculaceae bacterium]|nr:hypothetical protein [Muribaculaceae bacterium]